MHYYLLATAPILFAGIYLLFMKALSRRLLMLSAATFLIFCVFPGWGLVIFDSFVIQFAAFLAMPLGGVLCMIYLLLLMKSQTEIAETGEYL